MPPVLPTLPADTPLYLVAASRGQAAHFSRASLLGQSLAGFPAALRPQLLLKAANEGPHAAGLPRIYNQAISRLPAQGIVVFLHDDLFLHDWHLAARLQEALEHFDLVGLVGCVQAPDDQPSWGFSLDDAGQPQRCSNQPASGCLNHFDPLRPEPVSYGPAPSACRLLDGVFLALRLETLHRTGLRFDEQFRFHCYDGDFCRSAEALGLRTGTWPIACTHGSPGAFGSSWREQALLWRQKWCSIAT
ncbi:glycosyltransferase [Synechococcus sp. EJ6-Ellesmere]|uniref:glycosyltransferase n=1 Tax=Synechococcus sp. EJ6-Ellesmere TaxID=2823734 RepID=UPI0020CEECCB|nr:glycosyltransferase [Synechococcus sp. EJ6-Ellesmere]MCP9824138.1 hypothetical protein [Synechococcus sp. EJ6-Ellesmere]